MAVRHPFYELAAQRVEADGSLRRCFRARDASECVLFVWQSDDQCVVHAQLLLDDEAFVEWRGSHVSAGKTSRAVGETSPHARHKGVRTLADDQHDARVLAQAQLLLQNCDLPEAVVAGLLARLIAVS